MVPTPPKTLFLSGKTGHLLPSSFKSAALNPILFNHSALTIIEVTSVCGNCVVAVAAGRLRILGEDIKEGRSDFEEGVGLVVVGGVVGGVKRLWWDRWNGMTVLLEKKEIAFLRNCLDEWSCFLLTLLVEALFFWIVLLCYFGVVLKVLRVGR